MARTTIDALAARLAPLIDELIRHEDVRRDAIFDRVTSGDRLRAGTLTGLVPANTTGVVPDESIEVTPNALSGARDLETMLVDLVVAIQDARMTIREADGLPSGQPLTLVVPDASLTWNAATGTATLALTTAMVSGRWEPATNGDPAAPAIYFDVRGDVVMQEVA